MRTLLQSGVLFAALVFATPSLSAQRMAPPSPSALSELRDTVSLFISDRGAMLRRWSVPYSPARAERLTAFYSDWRARLARMDFNRLSQEGKIDYILLDNRLRQELDQIARDTKLATEMRPYVPFGAVIAGFEEGRRRFETPDGQATAKALAELAKHLDSLTKTVRARQPQSATIPRAERIVGLRSVAYLGDLQTQLRNWYRFTSGYDPEFSWWTADPYRRVTEGMTQYQRAIREVVVGQKQGEEEPIIGDPIGIPGVNADLGFEMIAYTPQELIRIAEQEFAWIEAEQRKAAREMGFGDDTRAALEKVKQAFVPPGKQPAMVRDLARYSVKFITDRDLVTVPPLADEVWRMEMMPPRQQLVSPFFLGGEVIQVAYPTDSMQHADKLMAMRGNNPHFSLATVHHELIPGHHLQGFMTQRHNPHRGAFSTPFWGEGWALWWEMLLWDEAFPTTPEDRMGMLFWRSHRAARIIFSLRFQLGEMTPQEAIDFLVDRVGHERANAEAEVRRSFNGTYSPMYQAAYMLGGLQFRALHTELVKSGRMTNKEFHDAILQGGRMPVEMVRARMLGTGKTLTRDYKASWRFYSF